MSQPKNSAQPVFALADNEALTDKYMNISMLWTHYISQRSTTVISENQSASEELHSFRLRVHHKHSYIVPQYLEHVRREADAIEKGNRELLVSTLATIYLLSTGSQHLSSVDIFGLPGRCARVHICAVIFSEDIYGQPCMGSACCQYWVAD